MSLSFSSLDAILSSLDLLHTTRALIPPTPSIRIPNNTHTTRLPEIPLEFTKIIRPEWNQADIKKFSTIITYRESGSADKFMCDFRIRESAKTFWTALRFKYTRNVPAKFRIIISFSDDIEYTIFDWEPLPKNMWIPLKKIIPAFYTTPGQMYVQVEVPEINGDSEKIHVVFEMLGFQEFLPSHPRWDLHDDVGNRLLTWIPDDVRNNAKIYHHLYNLEPPFEPNMEILPSPI